MICLAALILFSILGIFSLTYRKLAREAFACIFRRVTFRPCTVGFTEKVKAMLTGKVMGLNAKLGKILYKYFEIFAWFFVILSIVSFIYVARGFYNYARFGTCNPENPESCLFTTDEVTVCSNAEHCQPCNCGADEESCTAENNYAPCGGEESCDCNEVCRVNLEQ